MEVGLGYLSLGRQSGTLSGGEAQRVKMVRHLGSPLSDVTYVFDEPTTGLHPHDITRMNQLLTRIRDKGNTVLVVEHKPEVIAAADHIIDIGPGSGEQGGEVVFTGTYDELLQASTTTAASLSSGVRLREHPRNGAGVAHIDQVSKNNLHDVSVDIPLHTLTCVTGVAGSGKSSLVHGGLGEREDVLVVDQSGIRGSRRSTPATYTGVMDRIRSVFAKENGVKASLFSANSEGACPMCNGLGVVYTDLHITAGVAAPCEECGGKRFKPEVLKYTVDAGESGYEALNISEVLDLPVREAVKVFRTGQAYKSLARLMDVGLPYLRLGQPLNTLSGGERQRLKLAANMDDASGIIVLDEPTSGLHPADTHTIIEMMHSLVEDGRTVVCIEHNLTVMAAADYLIDIGPGAGHAGGEVVFTGSPAELVEQARAGKADSSLTGRYLAQAVC